VGSIEAEKLLLTSAFIGVRYGNEEIGKYVAMKFNWILTLLKGEYMNPIDIPLKEIREWFVYAKEYKWIENKYDITREQIEECIQRYVEEVMSK